MADVHSYIDTHRERFLGELIELLRIPSISADPAHKADVERAAQWLLAHLRALGLEAELWPTEGHPVVYGQWLGAPEGPTVLCYGHYDVQPPDPLNLWQSPPFEPTIRDGRLYARGASDDKGQLFTHLKALEAYLRTEGRLPVNVKFLIEGEEEVGSRNLLPVLEKQRDRLRADVVLISDTAMFGPEEPSITYALRGLCYLEIELEGPNRDLHSGVYGGAVDNPALILARMLAALHDAYGRVTVPGFYDRVRPLDEAERRMLRQLPFDEEAYKRDLGLEALWGEIGYTPLERATARPALDVNGLWGGYQGPGAKTVLPARAGAKLSARLVPDQRSEEIAALITAHLQRLCPPTARLTVRRLHGGEPVLVPLDHPALQAAARACEYVFGRKPYFVREGGSIPVVAAFDEVLGLKSVLLGFGLNTDAIHSPNEHFRLENFRRGIHTIAAFWREVARGN